MLMAVVGDIHGNLPALEAVLHAIDEAGIETVLNTGDAAVGYPWPNEVIEILRERAIPSVQGETDRLAATFLRKGAAIRDKWSPGQFAALQWTYDHTRSDNLEYLRSLPKRRTLTYETVDMMLCHGTPGGPQDELEPDDEEAAFLRQREIANVPLVLCGRTHRPFARHVMNTFFVNPGSVGMPTADDPRATYALVNTERRPWSAEIVRVEYDYESVLHRLTEFGLERP